MSEIPERMVSRLITARPFSSRASVRLAALITGGELSTMVISDRASDTLPPASVTVRRTCRWPRSEQSKVVRFRLRVTGPQLSKLPASTSARVMEAWPLASSSRFRLRARATGGV
ncbi:hypothetical protein D9M69_675990 [compost metagenome]